MNTFKSLTLHSGHAYVAAEMWEDCVFVHTEITEVIFDKLKILITESRGGCVVFNKVLWIISEGEEYVLGIQQHDDHYYMVKCILVEEEEE